MKTRVDYYMQMLPEEKGITNSNLTEFDPNFFAPRIEKVTKMKSSNEGNSAGKTTDI